MTGNPEDVFMSEMEKLGVKFVDATPNDGAFLPKRHTAPSEWEKEFEQTYFGQWASRSFECSDYEAMHTNLLAFIRTVRADAVEEAKELPMGVSAWMRHGQAYGYWDYFLAEERKRVLEVIGDTVGGRIHKSCLAEVIRSLLSDKD